MGNTIKGGQDKLSKTDMKGFHTHPQSSNHTYVPLLLAEFQPADVPALVVQIFHLHLHLLVLPLQLDDALPEVFARHH